MMVRVKITLVERFDPENSIPILEVIGDLPFALMLGLIFQKYSKTM
jgi:hypothetical protein